MLKIQKAIVLFLCFSGFSQAYSQTRPFGGLYGGINVGDSLTTTKYDLQSNGLSTFPLTGFELRAIANGVNTLNKNSIQGGLVAGFGQSWNCFYLGLEGFVDVSDNKMQALKNTGGYIQPDIEILTIDNTIDFKVDSPIYGIALRPGILLDPTTLLFLNLGLGFTRISMDLTSTAQDHLFPTTMLGNLFRSSALMEEILVNMAASERHKSTHFFRIGAGLEERISDHLSLRLEYIYSNLGSLCGEADNITALSSQNFGPGVITTHSAVNSILRNSTVKLGLSYYCPSFETRKTCTTPKNIGLCKSLYFGGSAGGIFNYPSKDIYANNQNYFPATLHGPQDQNFFFDQSGSFNKDSLLGSLFIGKGYRVCSLYLGGEAFLNLNSANMTSDGLGGTNGYLYAGHVLQEVLASQSDILISSSVLEGGIDLRPGFFVNRTLFYGRVGVAIRAINIQSTNHAISDYVDSALFPANSLFPITASSDQNKTLTGLRLGIGIEKMISDNFSLRAEFINTQYPKVALSDSNSRTVPEFNPLIGPGTITASNHFKTKLRDNRVLLGLSYYL